MDDDNARVETRLELTETIFIEVLSSSNEDNSGKVILCNSLDLSANGLQVVVDTPIPSGSILRLCIDMKDQEPIFLVAEVKWQRPDKETGGHCIGFLIFESDDTDILRWKNLMARLLSEKAEKRPG